ncbi:ATP-binding cassette domain-containing protein [Porphyrobacter algicida]|uniref:ATP-binding cassette domain-containing protein n=1 Tax=Qipengyuania algicida TaxID=1836209 RepID=A0A845AFS9_9SPHN|nr:ABC transporter ATP-binding protein [Qipengyuania algicida]MXP27396.1 ATP-binding cassette domain-containing protein [Qipengyuania algicida]
MRLAAQAISVAKRLSDVSLMLEPGTITAICGPNGAGKSTLLETLAGLLEPDSGAALLDGEPLAAMTPRTRGQKIGYLPQAHEIAWDVPVRSLVALGRMPHGDSDPAPVAASLAALDLQSFAERRAQSLSGGETARVLLARVLAGEPAWILADEPLAALDLAHQLALLRHLRSAAKAGAGVVLVLHDLALAMNHADRVVVLDKGRVAADGGCENALATEVVERVWGVTARWIGEPGQRALVTF